MTKENVMFRTKISKHLLDPYWEEAFDRLMAMDTGKDAAKAARSIITAETPKKLTEYQTYQILDDAYAMALAELTTIQELLIQFNGKHRRTPPRKRPKDSYERLTLGWQELIDTMEYYFEVTEEFEDGR